MPREYPRSRRVGEEIHRLLSEALQREFSDPRLTLVSITEVEVSKDLSVARVFFRTMSGAERADEVGRALRTAGGRLRHLVGSRMKTRAVPELRFEYDDSMDRGERISALLAASTRAGSGGD